MELSGLQLQVPEGLVPAGPAHVASLPECRGALFVRPREAERAVCYATQKAPCKDSRLLFESELGEEGHQIADVQLGALSWERRGIGFGFEYARCEREERTEIWVTAPWPTSEDDPFVKEVEGSLSRAKVVAATSP